MKCCFSENTSYRGLRSLSAARAFLKRLGELAACRIENAETSPQRDRRSSRQKNCGCSASRMLLGTRLY